jgi:RNA polymerase sigma-70 factor (ECF subfamily)
MIPTAAMVPPLPGPSAARSHRLLSAATAALPDSAALMECVTSGDERALAVLYDRYAGLLYSMLLRILNDTGEAEEVLQDLFLQVWRRADRFDASRGRPLAWLVVMGRSRALSRLRITRRRETVQPREEFCFESVASPADLENEIARRQLAERLRAALQTLRPKQKEVLELAYFEGLTQTEIAIRTETPLGTVKSRARAALQTLKESFAKQATQTS